MKAVSFRVRKFFDSEVFLTFNISDEANLDEDILDFLEDEEPEGIVPIIYEEEDECDTFSYEITDKIHLSDLSNQEINAEMVLLVLRGIILAFIDMQENRIPLSYLVLNQNYVYIDADYKVEFICIPLEEMKGEADVLGFLRTLIAGLRYDPTEDISYVARLLTYVNNPANFNLRNMEALIEELMEQMQVNAQDDESAEIYADYQEIEEEPVSMNSIHEVPAHETSVREYPVEDNSIQDDIVIEEPVRETPIKKVSATEVPIRDDIFEEKPNAPRRPKVQEDEDELAAIRKARLSLSREHLVEPELMEDNIPVEEDDDDEQEAEENEAAFKTRDAMTGIVIEDDFDEFLAEKEREERLEESNIKIKKNIKINRASIVKSTQEEMSAMEEEEEQEPESSTLAQSIIGQTLAMTGILGATTPPKINPYLIRVNTEERVMVDKQNFKIGKANMGVDFTVKGNGAVSRIHAVIVNKDGVYYIKDNKSTNHTYVNGKVVQDGETELLTHDCRIVLGDEEFTFKLR